MVPFAGCTANHPKFELAVKAVAPLAPSTRMVCGGGFDLPSVWENDKDVGVTIIVDAASDTVKVTGTIMVVVPAVIVTEP